MREVQHLEPIWRDRSNFIIAAEVVDADSQVLREQLWVRQISDSEFELCCIPFFLYDIALGDVVETAVVGPRKYLVDRVLRRSGRFVFRVWFGDPSQVHDEVAQALGELGALVEWSSKNLLAVDARDGTHAQLIADFLASQEGQGRLLYETGKTA